ncbi:hypothetical protein GJAV_G00054070 [Gymnothorax javanicus]|nr:hypothetical protein GJAV_G00054070 [Gymnothorax javanicus]
MAAEERMKRAEELEKQRQEQVELLQRLAEERRSLEIQMQEAQLERERLQAAVGEHPEKCVRQELPVHEQEVPSLAVVHLEKSPEAPSSVLDDAEEHAKRIRQYQQRLLDQNRQHKRSVQEARHRLAEYQHALKMRHTRALLTALSAASVQNVPAPAPTAEILSRPRPPCTPDPAQTLPPPLSTVPTPVPLPCPETMSNLRFGLSPVQSSDHVVLSQSVSHMPAQDPRQKQQTPLPHPTSASEPSLPAQPPLEHGSETRLTSPALQQADTCPHSSQLLPATPGVTTLETQRPAPVSTVPHSQPQSTSPTPPAPEPVTEAEPSPAVMGAEPWRRELEEARERVERQRLAVLEQQREQEERLLRQQSLLQEQMRRHHQALDSFLTGAQVHQSRPVESGSEASKEHRLGLMSSLLRAIEESNDSLSQPQGGEPPFVSSVPSAHSLAETLRSTAATSDLTSPSDRKTRLAAHTRAPRPPLARPKLGILEIIEQHELSAIQEVETPNDASFATIGEESPEGSSVLRDEPEKSEDMTSAAGAQSIAEREHWSGSSSVTGRSSRLSWRERLQLESGSSPEPDVARAACATRQSSDEGRGVVTPPGPAFLKAREEGRVSLPCFEVPSEAVPADPESLSSFTISTGSLSANEPDFSCTAVDVSLPSSEAAAGRGTLSPALPHSSMSSQGSLSPESLMGSDSIQRIIDKYTRELSHSLAAAGSFAAAPSPAETSSATWRAVLEQVESSSSITSPFSGAQTVPEGQLLTPETIQNAGRSSADLSLDDSQGGFGQIASTGAAEDVSKCSFDGAQSSPCLFLPLEPRLEYDSSTSSGSRHSGALEPVRGSEGGQVTGHLLDQSTPRYQAERRDSTHSIGGPSAQSTSHWINEARDISSTESFGPLLDEPSSQLLGPGQQATEWEELSEGQRSASSGGAGGAVLSSRLVGAPAQPGQSSEPVVHRGSSLPESRLDTQAATSTLTQMSQSSDQDIFVESSKELQHSGVFQEIYTGDTLGQDDTIEEDATLVDPSSDSFHPLPAEVTQNEMSEASMTFHPSMQDPHSLSGSDPTALTAVPSINTDPNTTLEPPHSPELLRGGSRDPSLAPCPPPWAPCACQPSPTAAAGTPS